MNEPTKRSLILYSSLTPASDRKAVVFFEGENSTVIYIRAQKKLCDVAQALSMAKPRKDEIVLNTIPLP